MGDFEGCNWCTHDSEESSECRVKEDAEFGVKPHESGFQGISGPKSFCSYLMVSSDVGQHKTLGSLRQVR